jgi:hypothetical protein
MEVDKKIIGNRYPNGKFAGGMIANPLGRPKLPEYLQVMKHGSLANAIEMMYEVTNDKEFMEKLKKKPRDLVAVLEMVFDRCGLPKITRNEGDPDVINLASILTEAVVNYREKKGLPPLELTEQGGEFVRNDKPAP